MALRCAASTESERTGGRKGWSDRLVDGPFGPRGPQTLHQLSPEFNAFPEERDRGCSPRSWAWTRGVGWPFRALGLVLTSLCRGSNWMAYWSTISRPWGKL